MATSSGGRRPQCASVPEPRAELLHHGGDLDRRLVQQQVPRPRSPGTPPRAADARPGPGCAAAERGRTGPRPPASARFAVVRADSTAGGWGEAGTAVPCDQMHPGAQMAGRLTPPRSCHLAQQRRRPGDRGQQEPGHRGGEQRRRDPQAEDAGTGEHHPADDPWSVRGERHGSPREWPTTTAGPGTDCVSASVSQFPYQAMRRTRGRRPALSPGWPGRSRTTTRRARASSSTRGRHRAAFMFVPGRSTTLGSPSRGSGPVVTTPVTPADVTTSLRTCGMPQSAIRRTHQDRTSLLRVVVLVDRGHVTVLVVVDREGRAGHVRHQRTLLAVVYALCAGQPRIRAPMTAVCRA